MVVPIVATDSAVEAKATLIKSDERCFLSFVDIGSPPAVRLVGRDMPRYVRNWSVYKQSCQLTGQMLPEPTMVSSEGL